MAHAIVNVGYRSTNYWVVSGRPGTRLLVDLGWPGMFGALAAECTRKGVPMREITHGLATHYHMDHAGCAQDLKRQGMQLLVVDLQRAFIAPMAGDIKPDAGYTPITLHDNVPLTCASSRAFLATLGIAGEIAHTPGHSDDSVSLVLDDGAVFTGDLTWPTLAPEAPRATLADSWARLRALGARQVHPGHGPVRPMPEPDGDATRE